MASRFVFAALALVVAASCAPRRPAPPVALPAPRPLPAPAPVAPAPSPNWEAATASPGDWRWSGEAGSLAQFGGASAGLRLRCEANGRILLVRTGAMAAGTLVVRTSTGERSLPATLEPGGLSARLPAADPILDAMVLSRGRFAVEAPGVARLIVPAWPEPARVIEDCRV